MVDKNAVKSASAIWPNAGSGQIPSLDGLRAISIMIVFFAHAGVSDRIPGGFGVTVFFFLSGFLITTLLCREHARTQRVALKAFYLRRIIRLGPPLLLTLALGALLVVLGLAAGDLSPAAIAAQVLFVFNYYSLLPDAGTNVRGFAILWSLSVEEHFYFVWPILFIAIAAGKARLMHVVMLLGFILIWRCVRVFVLGSDEWTIYISTDTRFDSLLYGCLLAILMAQDRVPDWVRKPQVFYPVILACLLCLLVTFLLRDPVFRSTLRYTVQGIALMPLFYYAVRCSDHVLFRPLNHWAMRRIGIYSYTLYLVHYVILFVLWDLGLEKGSLVSISAAAVLSLAWAAAVYRFAEQPLHGLRAKLNAMPAASS